MVSSLFALYLDWLLVYVCLYRYRYLLLYVIGVSLFPSSWTQVMSTFSITIIQPSMIVCYYCQPLISTHYPTLFVMFELSYCHSRSILWWKNSNSLLVNIIQLIIVYFVLSSLF